MLGKILVQMQQNKEVRRNNQFSFGPCSSISMLTIPWWVCINPGNFEVNSITFLSQICNSASSSRCTPLFDDLL